MAAYSLTKASVLLSSGGATNGGTAAVAINAGEFLYLDPLTSKLKLAIAGDAGTLTEATVVGMALDDAGIGQPVRYATSGTVTATAGAAFVAGAATAILILSATAGKCCIASEFAESRYLTVIGWVTSPTTFVLNIVRTNTEYLLA